MAASSALLSRVQGWSFTSCVPFPSRPCGQAIAGLPFCRQMEPEARVQYLGWKLPVLLLILQHLMQRRYRHGVRLHTVQRSMEGCIRESACCCCCRKERVWQQFLKTSGRRKSQRFKLIPSLKRKNDSSSCECLNKTRENGESLGRDSVSTDLCGITQEQRRQKALQ